MKLHCRDTLVHLSLQRAVCQLFNEVYTSTIGRAIGHSKARQAKESYNDTQQFLSFQEDEGWMKTRKGWNPCRIKAPAREWHVHGVYRTTILWLLMRFFRLVLHS